MSYQERSSADYVSENSAGKSQADLRLEAAESTRGAEVIKFINMLLLFVVVASLSGGAYWLYQNQDDIPQLKKSDAKNKSTPAPGSLTDGDVNDVSGGRSYNHDKFMQQLERQNEETMERMKEQQLQVQQAIESQQRRIPAAAN